MPDATLESLLKLDTANLSDAYDDVYGIVQQVNIEAEKDESVIKNAFQKVQKVILKVIEENRVALELFEQETEKATKKEQELNEELEIAQKQLKIYQQDPGSTDARELTRLESKNEQLRNELKELETKCFQEKADKDKLQLKIDDLDKKITKLQKDNERYEEEIREYSKKFQSLRDEKYSRTGEESDMFRERISQKNKIIDELENENLKLIEENQELNRFVEKNRTDLQESAFEMEKTRDEIRKLRLLQKNNDENSGELRKENEILKSQIELLNQQILNQQNQDSAIMSSVENRVNEFKFVISTKDEEIKKLRTMIVNSKEEQNRHRLDTDKETVSALSKVLQEKDKQIEIFKKQIEEYAREMNKSAAVIQSMNETYHERAKSQSKSDQAANSNKTLEQRIVYLEGMLRESETRLRESESHAVEKERALNETLVRMREYESGDYQLQQAVNEIKALKGQLKVRDADIETLTKHLNKLDYTLGDVLQENDDLRAKLGMEPKEKLNIDELNNLRSIRAQESRAFVYVLQKEIENLSEERNTLKLKIRKLAKQIGSKETVASILEYDTDAFDALPANDAAQRKHSQSNTNANGGGDSSNKNRGGDNDKFVAKKNEQLMQLVVGELENENTLLRKGLVQIHEQLQIINSETTGGAKTKKTNAKIKEFLIKCPSLDKVLDEFEANRNNRLKLEHFSYLDYGDGGGGKNAPPNGMRGEFEFLQGVNQELRNQLAASRAELGVAQKSYMKAQDQIEKLSEDVRIMNNESSAKDIFQPFKLPAGMSPSSQDIISQLNEYLIDTLQELENYKQLASTSEKELTYLRRKFGVSRHQMQIFYKEYMHESQAWKSEKEQLNKTITELNNTIKVDKVKLQEYDRLLETLEGDEATLTKRIAENSRQIHLLRSKLKSSQLKGNYIEEANLILSKEINKSRIEVIESEIAVQQRIGYLERYKDMANFRICNLQKKLEESVPVVKLDVVNGKYEELVQTYRKALDQLEASTSEHASAAVGQVEQLKSAYEHEMAALRNELECEREKTRLVEENNWSKQQNHHLNGGGDDVLSMSKRLAAIQIKELNERQRADHAQRLYDKKREELHEIETRNFELEHSFKQLTAKYLALEKSESSVRDKLTHFVPKAVSDKDRKSIRDLEKHNKAYQIEVSRLKELVEIILYQSSSLDFINSVSRAELEYKNLINMRSAAGNDVDKFSHREYILMKISEATVVKKLQQAQSRCKQLEAQLIRSEQKHDNETMQFFNYRNECISKLTFLRSNIQDLRNKYAGSIPLKQQERVVQLKKKLAEMQQELSEKILAVKQERHEQEDAIAEYRLRVSEIEAIKAAIIKEPNGHVRFSQTVLESFKKMEGIKVTNLKLDRLNKRYKDELTFLEEVNRKKEITILSLEEENLKLDSEFEAKMLIWERRESDLEKAIEDMRKKYQQIESLAADFESLNENLPDKSLPLTTQLDQAMEIIRSHIKISAEAKLKSDAYKKRLDELEKAARKAENEVIQRDRVIADLRLRLPATVERDNIIKNATLNSADHNNMTSIKAAQGHIESLQNRLMQKESVVSKYQDMLKLSREEILALNKQHEIEIRNILESLNATRDTRFNKLKQELSVSSLVNQGGITTKAQLMRLQELQELDVEKDNEIRTLHQKIAHLTNEIDSWRVKYELLKNKKNVEFEKLQSEQIQMVENLNKQLSEYREAISKKEAEIETAIQNLEQEKKQSNAAPSKTIVTLVDKLKQQLTEKEKQQSMLNQALAELKNDMNVFIQSNFTAAIDNQAQEQKIKAIIEKTSTDYQDKIYSLGEENVRLKKELKEKSRANEDLTSELDYYKKQLKSTNNKLKKLGEENMKLLEGEKHYSSSKLVQNLKKDDNINEIVALKQQIRLLESIVKRQQQQVPTRGPQAEKDEHKIKNWDSKEPLKIKTKAELPSDVSSEIEQWKTRYNYVLSEKAILSRQLSDMEQENTRLRREINEKNAVIFNENKLLKDELTNLKARGKSPINLKKKPGVTSASKEMNTTRDDDSISNASTSSNSSRKIGQSGKSPEELEKTIYLMKKVINKLQLENQQLKSGSSNI